MGGDFLLAAIAKTFPRSGTLFGRDNCENIDRIGFGAYTIFRRCVQ